MENRYDGLKTEVDELKKTFPDLSDQDAIDVVLQFKRTASVIDFRDNLAEICSQVVKVIIQKI